MTSNSLDQLQTRLGYSFNDSKLLRRALTHRSFGATNNERLEFLGDSVLGVIVGEALFHKFPEASEGQLTRLRSALVKGETLAKIARELELGACLVLGEGELKSGGDKRDSILADAVESIIGAIYLEQGLPEATRVVLAWLSSRIDKLELAKPLKDTKTQLQEFLQAQGKPLPEYTIVEVQGQAHDQVITVSCRVTGVADAITASARSRKQAEKLAAENALQKLQGLQS